MTQRRNGPAWWVIGAATAALVAILVSLPAAAQSADPLPYNALDAYPHVAPGGGTGPARSTPPGTTSERPPCRCQNYGTYLFVGDVACIRTNKGPRMARCILKGNNTMWEFLTEPCPVS